MLATYFTIRIWNDLSNADSKYISKSNNDWNM